MWQSPKAKPSSASPKYVDQSMMNRYAHQFAEKEKKPEMPMKQFQESTQQQLQNMIQQNMIMRQKEMSRRTDDEEIGNGYSSFPMEAVTESFAKILAVQQEEFARTLEAQKKSGEDYIQNMTDMYLKALKEQKDSTTKYLKQLLKNQIRDKQDTIERDESTRSEIKRILDSSMHEDLLEEIRKELREQEQFKRKEELKQSEFVMRELEEIKEQLAKTTKKSSQDDKLVGDTLSMVAGHLDKVLLKMNEQQIKEQQRVDTVFDIEPKIDLVLSKVEQIFEQRAQVQEQQHSHELEKEIEQLREREKQLMFKSKTLETEIDALHVTQLEQFEWKYNMLRTMSKFFENPIQKNILNVQVVFSGREEEQKVNYNLMDQLKGLLTYGTKIRNDNQSQFIDFTYTVAGDEEKKIDNMYLTDHSSRADMFIYVALPESTKQSHIHHIHSQLKNGNNFIVLVVEINGKRARLDNHILSWVHIGSEYEKQGFVHELYLQLLPAVVSDTVTIPAAYGIPSTPISKHAIISLQHSLYDILLLRHLYKFSFGKKQITTLPSEAEPRVYRKTKSSDKELSVVEEPKPIEKVEPSPPPAIVVGTNSSHRLNGNTNGKKSQYYSKKHEEEFDDELSISDDDTEKEVNVKKRSKKAPVNKTHLLKIITDKKRLDRVV